MRTPNRLIVALLSSAFLFGAPIVSVADSSATDDGQTTDFQSPVPGVSFSTGEAAGPNVSADVAGNASVYTGAEGLSSAEGDDSDRGNPDVMGAEEGSSDAATEQGDEEGASTPSPIDQLAQDHANDVADGVYCISSSLTRWSAIDISGGSSRSGANAQLYRLNATKAQIWKIRHEGDYVVIENAGSGKVLDVAGGSFCCVR